MDSFYQELFKLKNLIRTGWQIHIKQPIRLESDAEHCFSCCMLAIHIINTKSLTLDQEKVLKMLLCHEFGELEAGDITPYDNISVKEKHRQEKVEFDKLCKEYGFTELKLLWEEFEKNETPEARFCRAIDKLDTVLQAKEYSKIIDNPELFEHFLESSKDKIDVFSEFIK